MAIRSLSTPINSPFAATILRWPPFRSLCAAVISKGSCISQTPLRSASGWEGILRPMSVIPFVILGVQGGAMKTRVDHIPNTEARSPWQARQIAVVALTLVFVFLPALMSIPPPRPPMGFHTAPPMMPMQARAKETCPPGDHCGEAFVAQALPRLPVPPLLLLALVVVVVFATRGFTLLRTAPHDWLWPPDRRRAFLQVFLI